MGREAGLVPLALSVAMLVGFPIAFFALWTFVATILTRVSGLSSVRRLHPPREERLEPSHSWASGRIGGVRYRSALSVGLGERGLHVGPNLLFRSILEPGLPCIPWGELELLDAGRPASPLLALFGSGGVRVLVRGAGVELLLYGEAGREVAARLGGAPRS